MIQRFLAPVTVGIDRLSIRFELETVGRMALNMLISMQPDGSQAS